MLLNNYLEKNFPELELKPPLFYNWDTGIRFELGTDCDSSDAYENNLYLEQVYKRATALFKSIHSQDDDIYLVVDVDDFADNNAFARKLSIFSKYIKDKSVMYKLQQKTIPYVFPEDNEDGAYKTHRFVLKCKVSDLKYIPMLKAICNYDLGIKPSISHRVYIINVSKNTIFHVYDDRGCDLLATSIDGIRDIYEEYSGWILNYDKDDIDKIFKKDY